MKRRVLFAIALFFAVLVVAFFVFWQKAEKKTAPQQVNQWTPRQNPDAFPCAHAEEGTLSFKGRVKIHQRFSGTENLNISEGLKNPIVSSAINYQLKYLRGFFNSEHIRFSDIKVFPSSLPPQIRIENIEKVHYGVRLEVDQVEDYGPSPYVQKALKQRKIAPDEPSFLVSYQIVQPVFTCKKEGAPPLRYARIILPLDPFLAFWMVPAESRMEITYGSIKRVTNPCASADMADLKVPSYYWYAWHPMAKYPKFDCATLLGSEKLTLDVQAKFESNLPGPSFQLGTDLEKITEPIRATIVYGTLSPWTIPFDAKQIAQFLVDKSGQLDVADAARRIKEQPFQRRIVDSGVKAFVLFLDKLLSFAQFKESRVQVVKNHILISLKGRLRKSLREIELTLFVGITSQDKDGSEHWSYLANGFSNEDIVIYWGHSGMGLNFDFDKISQRTNTNFKRMSSQSQKKPYQLYAFVGCDAYSYIEQMVASLRPPSNVTTDIVTMANSSYRPLIPLGLLAMVDDTLSKSKSNMLQQVSNESDVYIFKRIGN